MINELQALTVDGANRLARAAYDAILVDGTIEYVETRKLPPLSFTYIDTVEDNVACINKELVLMTIAYVRQLVLAGKVPVYLFVYEDRPNVNIVIGDTLMYQLSSGMFRVGDIADLIYTVPRDKLITMKRCLRVENDLASEYALVLGVQ